MLNIIVSIFLINNTNEHYTTSPEYNEAVQNIASLYNNQGTMVVPSLHVTGETTLSGSLNVAGTTTIGGGLIVSGTPNNSSNSIVSNGDVFTQNCGFVSQYNSNRVRMYAGNGDGSMHLSSPVITDGGGNLTVNGTATVNGNTMMNGNSDISGLLSMTSNVSTSQIVNTTSQKWYGF